MRYRGKRGEGEREGKDEKYSLSTGAVINVGKRKHI